MYSRGGIAHLAWKGEEARKIELNARIEDSGNTYEWAVTLLSGDGYEFNVLEHVEQVTPEGPAG